MNLLEILERTVDKLGLGHFSQPSGSYIQEKDGTRIAGKSFVELLEWALETGRFEEVTNEVPTFKKPKGNFGNCQYFRFEMPPEVEAFQGADMLIDLDVDLDTLRIQESNHPAQDGSPIPEIVTTEIEPRRVNFGHIIVGDFDGGRAVWTAHPGEVLPATPIEGIDQVPADTWGTLQIVHGDSGEPTLTTPTAIVSTLSMHQTIKLAG